MNRFQTGRGVVEIRELRDISEMVAAEVIQKQVWGQEIIPHPKEILIPVQAEGGLLAGAFTAGGELVGLLFGFPTRDPSVQHSQILATREDWRGLGIGARLKWFQRAWCLERGIHLVRWTVDPLRAPNASLNIRCLGATSATYLPDYYGPMQGIDAGTPTDRLLVEWRLASPRVLARSQGAPADPGFPEAQAANRAEGSRPTDPCYDLDGPRILVRMPEDFIQLAGSDPELALAWRLQTRGLLQAYFAAGYRITEFTRRDGPAYLLEKDIPYAES